MDLFAFGAIVVTKPQATTSIVTPEAIDMITVIVVLHTCQLLFYLRTNLSNFKPEI